MTIARIDGPLPGLGLAGRLRDFLAFVEGPKDHDATLAAMEGSAERILRFDGFRSGVDWPWPSPVSRVGKAPAHVDDAACAGLRIPDDDRQQTSDPEGDDFVVAAFAQVAVAALLSERLRERDHLAPRGKGREFSAHETKLA